MKNLDAADRSSRPHHSPTRTKLGQIPDGGGWRYVGRAQGKHNREATARRTGTRNHLWQPQVGTAFVHTVVDDHSRVAYAEICADEKATTAIGVLRRATAWFTDRGVTVERVLTDNGSAYKSYAWRDACTELGITPKKTRPYRPQTNGKVEHPFPWCCACIPRSSGCFGRRICR